MTSPKTNTRRFASPWNERMYEDLKAAGINQADTARYLGISLSAYNTVLHHFHFGLKQRQQLRELLAKARTAKQMIFEEEES